MTLARVLVRPRRVPVLRLLPAGGLRLRRRHAAAGAGPPRRRRPPRHDQHDRPGLGHERDVADRGGRLAVRRVPLLVRDPVQRLLPAAAADPRRADPARGGVRVPRQGRRPGVAAALGRRHRDRLGAPGAPVGRRVRQHRPGRADQRRRQLHRQPVHAAQPLRPARRPGGRRAVLHVRGDLRGAQDHRRHPRRGAGARRPDRRRGGRARRDVPGLDDAGAQRRRWSGRSGC